MDGWPLFFKALMSCLAVSPDVAPVSMFNDLLFCMPTLQLSFVGKGMQVLSLLQFFSV
jgi:hypothetical protein